MPSSAYIKLVAKSKQQTITLEEVKELINYYKDITTKTGTQLGWEYGSNAFPYSLEQREDGKDKWFLLKGNDQDDYKYIIVGVGGTDENQEGSESNTYIQVVLPDGSTHGDKGKANEFCKFLAKKLDAELQLFNGRTMYYYKR
ncbi:DUF1885 family protein [Alkalihalobacillus sp. AL-G]|uniref:DUF1885 family protein n=1 Tax=Alkalihalobacillus sp. AL-G TaxID=2926399 RepID=UPI00272BF3EE|nr:DUF1885 family protein [Alkalihalobacillus sp. AL-G]WLD95005.1 DUF1885 family protein [Alkalihalobacillus sp. AL-G]